jgi:phage terminase large subunit-like protein
LKAAAVDIAGAVMDKLMPPAPDPTLKVVDPGDVVAWAEDRFYIVETKRPVVLQPVQKAVLRAFSERLANGRFKWTTCLYSTIKKSGKTAMAALYQRWCCEMWGDYGEIYHMGNKLGQAKERAFKITKHSIEMAPQHERVNWEIQLTIMRHIPNHSFIQALPVNAAGEAGGNQRMTTWTELHGYVYDENDKMWSELMPVPTQFLSQRFAESYAGYEGESLLLKGLWDTAKAGERLHDEYPIWGNEAAGLIAYIDTGEEARRMPWQQGTEGRRYYGEMERTELPHEYKRLHLNEWVSSINKLIQLALWDRLEDYTPDQMQPLMIVAAADASVSGDSTALVVVGMIKMGIEWHVGVLESHIWEPPKGGKLDYNETIKPTLKQVLARYKVAKVTYDEYQLHDVMTTLKNEQPGTDFEAFDQGALRLEADTMLVQRIKQEKLHHRGDAAMREHVDNADSKASGDKKIRIIKRDNNKKIDAVVALSMAVHKAFELSDKPQSPPVVKMQARGIWKNGKHK